MSLRVTCSEEPDAVTPHVRLCEGEIQQWMSYSTKPSPTSGLPQDGSNSPLTPLHPANEMVGRCRMFHAL